MDRPTAAESSASTGLAVPHAATEPHSPAEQGNSQDSPRHDGALDDSDTRYRASGYRRQTSGDEVELMAEHYHAYAQAYSGFYGPVSGHTRVLQCKHGCRTPGQWFLCGASVQQLSTRFATLVTD